MYHRTATPAELALIEAQEERALRLACRSLVLSRSDAQYLRHHFPAATDPEVDAAPLHVLLPALRADMEALPPPPEAGWPAAAAEAAIAGSGTGTVSSSGTPPINQQQQGGQQQQQGPVRQQPGQHRRYLTCCVRLSPEKEPHRFVEVIEELQRRGSLDRLGVVPLMAGAGWGTQYGAELRRRLKQHVPQVRWWEWR